jgi:hypothetical protein
MPSPYEGARDIARRIASSWQGRVSRRLRKKVEMLFAHLKRILKLETSRPERRSQPPPRTSATSRNSSLCPPGAVATSATDPRGGLRPVSVANVNFVTAMPPR